MAAELSFRVLGPLEVSRDGERVRLEAAKPRALLAVLLIRRGDVHRDVLVDALWGADASAGARNTLQVYVSRLRRELGAEAIVTTPSGYRLEGGEVDADRFEELFATGSFESALDLWRGQAYGDLRYESFAQAEAGRLDELRLACLEGRIDAELEQGRHAALVGELEALAVEHPLRERFRGQLILALYRSGRQSEALEQYRAARRMLTDELGLEPSPELRELERMILAHDPALSAPAIRARSSLPSPPTPFVGREQELRQVVELVRAGSRRLVTLTGPGGTGKTRLAIEAGSALASEFEGGVWWVPLQSIRDVGLVLPAISAALQLVGGDLAAQVGDARMLLVLDNFEQLLDAGVETASLLSRCPNLRLLVTSREPLHVAAEREVRVPPMAEADAVALFDERAEQFVHDGTVVDAREVVAEICRRLDCLPLPVELAAARTKLFTPRQILARLNRRLAFLTRGPRDAPARQQALRATIEWSYDLLEPDEQQLLRDLSVFVGGCSYEAGEAIAGAGPDTLESLLDKSLMQRNESGIGPRYTLLETIREFACERSESAGGRDALCRRHAEWFISQSNEAYGALEGAGIPRWQPWEWYRVELPNLRAAFEWAFEQGESGVAQRLGASTGWAWYATGSCGEGREWLTRALEQTGPVATGDRARILHGLASFSTAQGDYATSEMLLEQALELYAQSGDARGAFHAAMYRIQMASSQGDFDRALAHLDKARTAFPNASGDWERAQLCFSEAWLEAARGEWSSAQALADEASALFTRHGYAREAGGAALNVAWFGIRAGDFARAKCVMHDYLADDSAWTPGNTAIAHGNLGLVAIHERDHAAAALHVAEQLKTLADSPGALINMKSDVALGLHLAAAVATMVGENERALRLWSAAGSIWQTLGRPSDPPLQFLIDTYIQPARAALEHDHALQAETTGMAMTPSEAIDYALEGLAREGAVAKR